MAEDLGSLRIKIEAPLTGLKLQMQGAKRLVKDFSGSVVKDIDRAKEGFMAMGMALGVVSAGIGVATGLAIKQASSFQHQMAEVSTIIEKDSAKWTSSLSKGVLQLSRDVPQSTDLLTRGLYDLLSATRPVETAMEDLGLASKAAVAGLSDVQSAVNLGTTVMNGMGEAAGSMTEIFDTAFETVRLGVVTFPQLAANIGQVIPPASKLGVSMKDVFGSMAFLTKTGLNAAEASVSLARAFDQIIEKRPALEGLGIKIFGEKGEFLGFQKVMEQIAGTLTGLTQEERANIFEEMGFDIRAARAITNISMNLKGFKSDLANITDASGAMGKAYNKVMDTSEEKTKLLKNQVKALVTEMGDNLLPVFDSVVGGLSGLVKGFSDLSEPMKKVIAFGIPLAGGG